MTTKYSQLCFKYSFLLLKINFIFIIIFQVIKLTLNNNDYQLSFDDDQSSSSSPVSSSSSSSSSLWKNLTNLIISFDLNKWKSFVDSLAVPTTIDLNSFEATKIEEIKLVNSSSSSAESSDIRQGINNIDDLFLITTSYYNFTQYLMFNNLRLIIRLAFIYNLNLNSILINTILISFYVNRQGQGCQLTDYDSNNKTKSIISYSFSKFNLILNNLFLFLILVFNLVYMFNRQFIQNDHLELFSFRLNILLMILCLILLGIYSSIYFRNDDEEEEEEENKVYDKNFESKKIDFNQFKYNKLEKNCKLTIQWIIHSILVIYLLNIWDVADLNQYYKAKSATIELIPSSEMNQLINNLKINQNYQERVEKFKSVSNNFNHSNQYTRVIQNQNIIKIMQHDYIQLIYENSDLKSTTRTQIKSITQFKLQQQYLGDILIILLTFFILFKINSNESYLNLIDHESELIHNQII